MKWKDRYEIELPNNELNEEGVKCEKRAYYKSTSYYNENCQNFDGKCKKCIRVTKKILSSPIRLKIHGLKNKLKYWLHNMDDDIFFICMILCCAVVIFVIIVTLISTGVIPSPFVQNITENITNMSGAI